MLRPKWDRKTTIDSMQVLNAFCQVMERYVPLELAGTRITPTELWQVLGYASGHASSLEAAATELAGAPSGNRTREVLRAALPERSVLQRQFNTALRAQLPRVLLKGKRSYVMALDLTLIPYHGQTQDNDPEVLRAKAKSGTHHFHGYATVSIVHHRRRYVLALRLVRPGERMVALVRDLLDRVRILGVRVRRVYLDKEFYAIDVFRTLDRRGLSYVVPLIMRESLKKLCQGRRSFATTHRLRNSRTHQAYPLDIVLVHRYRRSKGQRRVVHWFGFAVRGLPPGMLPRHVFELYRQRFGIETSYRQMNQVRARTSSRSPVLRLLFVGLALLLVNLYVTLRCAWATPTSTRPRRRFQWLTLSRLAGMLARAAEAIFHVSTVQQLRAPPASS